MSKDSPLFAAYKFDWAPLKMAMEAVIGPNSFLLDNEQQGGVIVEHKRLLALIGRFDEAGISIALMASLTPNTAALITSNIANHYNARLEPVFEFGKENELLNGPEAQRYAAENAVWLLYGEKQQSKDAIVVRPKGASLKHRIN
jgi:hypothetical protein